jgi:hypothetical protein
MDGFGLDGPEGQGLHRAREVIAERQLELLALAIEVLEDLNRQMTACTTWHKRVQLVPLY